MILHEIPIYAISEAKFRDRFKAFRESFIKRYSYAEKDSINKGIYIELGPKRQWRFNHIIGYITIEYEKSDIKFKLFLPEPSIKRYIWTSSVKKFMKDQQLNGMKFQIRKEMSSEKIQEEIKMFLQGIIRSNNLSKYFVDTRSFDNTNDSIDYRRIIDKENQNG